MLVILIHIGTCIYVWLYNLYPVPLSYPLVRLPLFAADYYYFIGCQVHALPKRPVFIIFFLLGQLPALLLVLFAFALHLLLLV